MENKHKHKILLDLRGDFRCSCCSSVISIDTVIESVKASAVDIETGKRIFSAMLLYRKYLQGV